MTPPVFRVVPWRLALAAALLTTPALSQTEVLVATGDSFPGIGTVDEVLDLAINGQGDWLAVVHGDTQLTNQMALIHNGTLVAKAGDFLPGASLPFLHAARLGLNDAGSTLFVAAHPAVSYSTGQGVYLDLSPVAEVGDPVQAPGITPGTTWSGFWDALLEPSGSVVVHGYGNDSAITGILDNMIVRFTPVAGGGWTEALLAARGQTLPGSPGTIHEFAEYDNGLDVDSSGELLSYVSFQSGPDAIYQGAVPLVTAGDQSPVFGRSIQSLFRMPLALNDQGDTVYGAYLSGDYGTREILVWNGIELAQQGDLLPSIAPHSLTSLGLASSIRTPLHMTDLGRALWYGKWDQADPTRDEGLFLDQELLVAESETHVDGSPIVDLTSFLGPLLLQPHPVFDITPDGKAVGLRATLADGRTGAFRIRPDGGVVDLPGCFGNTGVLQVVAAPKVGSVMTAQLSAAPVDGVLGFVFLSSGPASPGSPCGTLLPGIGEVLIDLTPPNPLSVVPGFWPAISGQTFMLLGPIPSDPALFGETLYLQGLWLDVTGVSPAEPIRLSNGTAVSIGQ